MIGHINGTIFNDYAKIDELYVLEDYQRQGYGISLFLSLINILKNKGVEYIYLVTNLDDSAKDLYIKYGFRLLEGFYQYLF